MAFCSGAKDWLVPHWRLHSGACSGLMNVAVEALVLARHCLDPGGSARHCTRDSVSFERKPTAINEQAAKQSYNDIHIVLLRLCYIRCLAGQCLHTAWQSAAKSFEAAWES